MKSLLLACILFSRGIAQAQPMNYNGGRGGTLSFGQRSTISTFNEGDERSALGLGGQFRIRLSERVNTEWFFDYLPATNRYTRRADYHIGWSVLFYPFNTGNELFVPYVLAGHCFDYTRHTDLSNSANQIDRWSSAVQGGIGTHINLTERLDISVSSQYMIHLGTDVHSHIVGGQVEFEQHKGGSLEGHLLFTIGFNYKFVDLWARD
jgi:opacity protein-like surface antigen